MVMGIRVFDVTATECGKQQRVRYVSALPQIAWHHSSGECLSIVPPNEYFKMQV